MFDKNAVPAFADSGGFHVYLWRTGKFCGKFAAEKGLPSGRLILCDYGSDGADYAYDGREGDRPHGEGIFAYSCNIAMFAAFLLLGLFPNTVTYLLAAVLSGFGFGGLEPALQSWRWRLHHPKSAAVQTPPSLRV